MFGYVVHARENDISLVGEMEENEPCALYKIMVSRRLTVEFIR
jgi:hypothetical protein